MAAKNLKRRRGQADKDDDDDEEEDEDEEQEDTREGDVNGGDATMMIPETQAAGGAGPNTAVETTSPHKGNDASREGHAHQVRALQEQNEQLLQEHGELEEEARRLRQRVSELQKSSQAVKQELKSEFERTLRDQQTRSELELKKMEGMRREAEQLGQSPDRLFASVRSEFDFARPPYRSMLSR